MHNKTGSAALLGLQMTHGFQQVEIFLLTPHILMML